MIKVHDIFQDNIKTCKSNNYGRVYWPPLFILCSQKFSKSLNNLTRAVRGDSALDYMYAW